MLPAHVDRHTAVRGRQGEAVMAQVTGDLSVQGAQGVVAGAGAGKVQILQLLWRDTAVPPDVVRNARRTADARRIRGGTGDQQGIVDVGEAQISLVRVEEIDVVVPAVGVVVPGVEEVTLRAEYGAVAGVLVVGGTSTAFDVATANLDVHRLRARVSLVRGDLGRRAQETRLLSAQQRVAAVG